MAISHSVCRSNDNSFRFSSTFITIYKTQTASAIVETLFTQIDDKKFFGGEATQTAGKKGTAFRGNFNLSGFAAS